MADIAFTVEQTRQAVENQFEYYRFVRETAIQVRAEQLKMSEADFRKTLNDPLFDDGMLTVADLNHIPSEYQKADFVPLKLHRTFTGSGALATAWMNAGIVEYSYLASMLDYIRGRPVILGHELVHRNIKLQNIILTMAVDVEMMASIPMHFEPEEKIYLWYQPYGKLFQELALVFFRFDFQKARKNFVVWRYSGGQMEIDEEEFRKYPEQVELMKNEFRRFFREVAIPGFYADPIYWAAVHERMKDEHLVMKVMMAKHYHPTLLGGKVETARWLSEHREQTSRFAHTAYKKSAEAKSHTPVAVTGPLESLALFLGISHRTDDDSVKHLDDSQVLGDENKPSLIKELLRLYRSFKSKEEVENHAK